MSRGASSGRASQAFWSFRVRSLLTFSTLRLFQNSHNTNSRNMKLPGRMYLTDPR